MSDLRFPDLPGRVHVSRTILNRTDVQEGYTGTEFRVSRYARPRYRFEVSFNFLRSAAAYQEAQSVASFLVRHGGRRESFLFRDPDDYTVTAHGFGVGDGSDTKFPLQRVPVGWWTDVLGTWPTYTTPRTNLVLRSQALATSPWAASTTRTNNIGIAPDGTLTASRTAKALGTANESCSQSVAFTEGTQYVLSMWLRATATSSQASLGAGFSSSEGWPDDAAAALISGPGVVTVGSNRAHVTGLSLTQWTQVRYTFTAEAGSSGVYIYPDGPSSTTIGAAVDVWGVQAETGSTATRYIPTTTAAVRSDPAYWTVDQTTSVLAAPVTSEGFEPVTEPVWSGVTIYRDGVALVPGTDFTFTASGVVTCAVAPTAGAALTWTGTYYKRVRFDEDEMDLDRIVEAVWEGEGIELVSVIA